MDATLGRGGHTQRILSQLTTGHLFSFDQDQAAIDAVENRLKPLPDTLTLVHRNFREIEAALSEFGHPKVDGILSTWVCLRLSLMIQHGDLAIALMRHWICGWTSAKN